MSDAADTVVFLGPTLSLDEARALLAAAYLPPAGRGDIKRLPQSTRRIVLIDGLFHGAPSVWQRELLAAVDAGVEVFGASSMGALRAVEVERYGVVGHGVVFSWYRDGTLTSDDEVALLHGDAETGWRALSEPLVNLRATLQRALAAAVITAAEHDALVTEARATFYPERSLARLTRGETALRWPAARRDDVACKLAALYVDQKREDARSLLRRCATTAIAQLPPGRRDSVLPTRGIVQAAPPTQLLPRAEHVLPRAHWEPKGHRCGTHRAVAPEVTLARITPHLPRWGITRLADVTGLDAVGIPTCCAIRPTSATVQVQNGKGLRLVDAEVSALMEALETAHMEGTPARPLVSASLAEMRARGEPFAWHLPTYFRPPRDPEGAIEWVQGTELVRGGTWWLPASVAWLRPDRAVRTSSHGLASGNTLREATLHALYEVLERHLLASVVADGHFDLDGTQVLDPRRAPDASVRELAGRVAKSGLRLVLMRVRTPLHLHACMAVLLDRDALGGSAVVNTGYGAHLSIAIAASRAITEAAQARLTYIHGARDDLREESYVRSAAHDGLLAFFGQVEPDTLWTALEDHAAHDLETDYARVLDVLAAARLPEAFCIDLSFPDEPFHVCKVVVPGTALKIG